MGLRRKAPTTLRLPHARSHGLGVWQGYADPLRPSRVTAAARYPLQTDGMYGLSSSETASHQPSTQQRAHSQSTVVSIRTTPNPETCSPRFDLTRCSRRFCIVLSCVCVSARKQHLHRDTCTKNTHTHAPLHTHMCIHLHTHVTSY